MAPRYHLAPLFFAAAKTLPCPPRCSLAPCGWLVFRMPRSTGRWGSRRTGQSTRYVRLLAVHSKRRVFSSAWSGLDGSFGAGRGGGTGELLLNHHRRERRAQRGHSPAAPPEHRAAEGGAAASRDRAARTGPRAPTDHRGTAQLPGSRQGAWYGCGQAQGCIFIFLLAEPFEFNYLEEAHALTCSRDLVNTG
jgi:hypothetical protein